MSSGAKRAPRPQRQSKPSALPVDLPANESAISARLQKLGVKGYAEYLRSLSTSTETYEQLRERWLHDGFEETLAEVKSVSSRKF